MMKKLNSGYPGLKSKLINEKKTFFQTTGLALGSMMIGKQTILPFH